MSIQKLKDYKVVPVEEREQIYDYMANENSELYNLTKTAEELLELSLALMQRVNKGLKVPDSEIIDEIGDVKIRLEVLGRKFSRSAVEKRVNKKLTIFGEYIKSGKYKNI